MSGIPAGAGSLLGKRLGKYEILALLALGGTAEIYLARIAGAAGFEKYVVVKCLHDHLADDVDFVKMFLDEARLAATLDHSNVVQTFELGEYESRYYMVLEFLAGLSLAMVVRRASERVPGGRLPVPLVLNMAAQACAGLQYAHERTANGKPLNIVHRDISPQNLVVSFEGVVKIVDFGIARADVRETKTKAGTIKGKFAYMSPEQCVANNVDRRTDVFALGVIVHELLTGRRLFKRTSPYETYQAVLDCAVAPPSTLERELDPALDAVIMKALAKDKDARYPTAEAFGDAMLGYLHHRGKGSGPGEIGRYFDQYFGQEIEEHGERMRELISGREFAAETAGGWDEEEDDKKGNMTVDLGPRAAAGEQSLELETGDLVEMRPRNASLDEVVSELGESRVNDDDEMPAEKTRIEANPLEAIAELAGGGGSPPTVSMTGPAPLPAPPTGPVNLKQGVVGGKSSGKFPDLANMPTMIAEETPPPSQRPVSPPDARPSGPAPVAPPPPPPRPVSGPSPVVAPPGPPPQVPSSGPQQVPSSGPQHPQQPPMGPSSSPYPVMQGRPFSSDLAPSKPAPGQHPPQRASVPDMHAAASTMSPVGDRYPQNVDWAAHAAQPARAIPPWLLAVLFAGALGGALLLTFLIAKLFH